MSANGKNGNGKNGNGHGGNGRGNGHMLPAKNGLPALNAREAKFVASYCVFFNGARAVREAGYDAAAPNDYARVILAKPHIQKWVHAQLKELGDLHFRLHDENTARLVAMRDADRSEIFTPQGEVRDIDEWPEILKLMIAGIEVEELWETDAKGKRKQTGVIRKVKFDSPRSIIDSLAKITGQWIERSQMIGKDGRPVDPQAVTPVLIISYGDQLPKVVNDGAT